MSLKVSLEECREIIKGYGRIPEEPKGYRFEKFATVKVPDNIYLTYDNLVIARGTSCPAGKRLILSKIEPKYRYICDDPTPRVPKSDKDFWITLDWAKGLTEFSNDYSALHSRDARRTIFRREEI